MPHKKKHKKPKKKTDQMNFNLNKGQGNINVNLNNKVLVSRQRSNLREIRRALPGSKALQGYTAFNIPPLQSQSALLTNTMMSQFNNFRRELESNQRQLQAQQQAFEQRAQQLNQIAANVGGPAPQMPIPQAPPPPIIPQPPPGNMGFGQQQQQQQQQPPQAPGQRPQAPPSPAQQAALLQLQQGADPFRGRNQLQRTPAPGARQQLDYGPLPQSPYGGRG
jgi:hypothetical protein